MIAHARAEAPNECCGLLVGEGSFIDECVAVRNMHPTPRTRYLLDPAEHIATMRRLRGTRRSIVGCYHSHPHSPPVPSATDLAEAYYPEFVWMIVSLQYPEHPELGAYRIVSDEFSRLMIAELGGS